MIRRDGDKKRFWWTIGATVGVAVLLFIVGALRNRSLDYWYLPYNLALAAIPLGFAFWIRKLLARDSWKDWRVIVLGIAWLLFLPNSFYIVTDFIHLPETMRVDIVQDSVMLMLFSLLGFFFGFTSLYLLHTKLSEYVRPRVAHIAAFGTLFLASFAIYLGRELRWNSWDIVSNPLHLFDDIFAIILHPLSHPNVIWMTGTFFAVLAGLYIAIWVGTNAVRQVDADK